MLDTPFEMGDVLKRNFWEFAYACILGKHNIGMSIRMDSDNISNVENNSKLN